MPDLVADLRAPAHQPIKIEAAFRTDSIRGGIRSTLDFAPDAPVSRVVLRMQGGQARRSQALQVTAGRRPQALA